MEAQLAIVVVECGVELVRPMDPAAIDDHHDVFAGFAEGGHHLMEILASLLGIKVGHDFIEDFRGAILDRADDAEQDAAGDATPRAIPHPGVAFEGFVTFDLTRAQRPCGEARALRFAPPTPPWESKAPEDGLIFIEQNDLATARAILQGCKFE